MLGDFHYLIKYKNRCKLGLVFFVFISSAFAENPAAENPTAENPAIVIPKVSATEVAIPQTKELEDLKLKAKQIKEGVLSSPEFNEVKAKSAEIVAKVQKATEEESESSTLTLLSSKQDTPNFTNIIEELQKSGISKGVVQELSVERVIADFRKYLQNRKYIIVWHQLLRSPITQHLRSADTTRGLPLPTEAEIAQREKILEPAKNYPEVEFLDAYQIGSGIVEEQKFPIFKKCEKSDNTTTLLTKDEKSSKAELLVDNLYLEKKDLPLSPEVKFGENTNLHIYDRENQDFSFYLLKKKGIDCLPFREMVFDSKLQVMTGAEALEKQSISGAK